jgi:E3 ubiquitin-protein ligase HUWE1
VGGASSSSEVSVASSNTPVIVTPRHYTAPHWLDISINAALGSHAKIFQLEGESLGKVAPSSGSKINIHPLAGTTISHNVLDVLIFLARHLGVSLLPIDLTPKGDDGSDIVSNFWQILLRLDGAVGRKGKGTMKGFKFSENKGSLTEQERFSVSIIGQLMTLFNHDIIGENVALTDKLLRLLSVASSSIPRTGIRSLTTTTTEPKNSTPFSSPQGVTQALTATTRGTEGTVADKPAELEDVFDSSTPRLSVVAPHLLNSVIAVLTSGKCSEEGLEEATTLLTNLSKCSIPTREQILYMLLNGVRTIGRTLCLQIMALDESVNAKLHDETLEKEQLQYQPDADSSGGGKKKKKAVPSSSVTSGAGVLSGVVLSGVEEQHIDHSHDLHIPTMAPLTCKGSQQSFFVRMLKVVCQLRESAQLALNAANAAASKNAAAATAAAAASSQQTSTQPNTAGGTQAGGEDTQDNVERTTANPQAAAQDEHETQEASGSQSKGDTSMDSIVEHKPVFLQMLSQQLELDELWCILSNCLDALSHTEDPHAVFVLQPTVEAFFLVHANYKDDGQKGKKKTPHTPGSRFSRLSSSSHLLESESNPASPSPFSPLPATPGVGDEVDHFAHLPPDTAKFLKFAGIVQQLAVENLQIETQLLDYL